MPTVTPTVMPTVTPTVIPTVIPTVTPTPTDSEDIKDKVFTIRKYTYQILSDEQGTVIITGLTKKHATKIRIRDTVKINGKKYKIVKVKASAFKKCKKAKKIIIGKNVRSIGKKAFFKCKNVKNIYIKSRRVFLNKKRLFGKISNKTKITLPNGKVVYLSKYKKRGN
ncbi:MAG: hypothetical protein E7267_06510 [Lachnospiraceae bacterium]|nr:hypothetical protein [Lachnospiraceae bacterium]